MNVIYGGSFNPPHLGHVEAVMGLLETPILNQTVSQVMILPSFGTPLKQVGVTFEQRVSMARAAFDKISDRVSVSDFEAKEQIQYTWQVLEKLGPKLEPLAFVIGTDQFEKLEQWARYPEFLEMSDWIVLLRRPKKLGDFESSIRNFVGQGWLKPTANELEFKIKTHKHSRNLVFVPTRAQEVSSSDIRTLFARGKKEEAKALLPQKVYEYIERNHLYGT